MYMQFYRMVVYLVFVLLLAVVMLFSRPY